MSATQVRVFSCGVNFILCFSLSNPWGANILLPFDKIQTILRSNIAKLINQSLINVNRNCSGSHAAEGWGVWCGGFTATPHPLNSLHAE